MSLSHFFYFSQNELILFIRIFQNVKAIALTFWIIFIANGKIYHFDIEMPVSAGVVSTDSFTNNRLTSSPGKLYFS